MQTCIQQHACALKSIVAGMAFERGEDRRQQNDRACDDVPTDELVSDLRKPREDIMV